MRGCFNTSRLVDRGQRCHDGHASCVYRDQPPRGHLQARIERSAASAGGGSASGLHHGARAWPCDEAREVRHGGSVALQCDGLSPAIPRPAPLGRRDAGRIGALEREIGFPLAPEVREWLSLCAGVQIGVFTLMGTNRRHGLVGILDALAPEWRTLQWCPVATDGCGNFYCVIRDTRTSTNPVVFVEATGPVVVQYVVASSFAYFLWFCLTDVGRILDGVSEGS